MAGDNHGLDKRKMEEKITEINNCVWINFNPSLGYKHRNYIARNH
jgi:hypothetical protein